ncbi:hypothetical protein E4625_09745 [Aeromonas hydrophila]|nr:hypothetical protein E4625_09745 [Aeromonas hydrophila]
MRSTAACRSHTKTRQNKISYNTLMRIYFIFTLIINELAPLAQSPISVTGYLMFGTIKSVPECLLPCKSS